MRIHPTSVLFQATPPPKFLLYTATKSTKQLYMEDVATIQPEWLIELAPHFYEERASRQATA